MKSFILPVAAAALLSVGCAMPSGPARNGPGWNAGLSTDWSFFLQHGGVDAYPEGMFDVGGQLGFRWDQAAGSYPSVSAGVDSELVLGGAPGQAVQVDPFTEVRADLFLLRLGLLANVYLNMNESFSLHLAGGPTANSLTEILTTTSIGTTTDTASKGGVGFCGMVTGEVHRGNMSMDFGLRYDWFGITSVSDSPISTLGLRFASAWAF
jgi:hypothetical protein